MSSIYLKISPWPEDWPRLQVLYHLFEGHLRWHCLGSGPSPDRVALHAARLPGFFSARIAPMVSQQLANWTITIFNTCSKDFKGKSTMKGPFEQSPCWFTRRNRSSVMKISLFLPKLVEIAPTQQRLGGCMV